MQQAEQEEMDEEEDEDEESDPYEPYEIIKSLPPLSSLVDPWRRCLLPKQKLQRKTLVNATSPSSKSFYKWNSVVN